MENDKNKVYDLKVRTREFSIRVLKFRNKLIDSKVEFFLINQLFRSCTSIGANIHEAKGSSSKKEFCRYYEIALRSANESEYWLEIVNELFQIEETKLLLNEVRELKKILAAIIIKLKSSVG